jgi:hypothetical protein
LKEDSPALRTLLGSVDVVRHLLEDCAAAGELPAGLDARSVHQIVASSLHGTATLLVCNRMPPGADARVQAQSVLEVAIAGLKSGALQGVRLAPTPRPGARARAVPSRQPPRAARRAH